MTAAPGPLLPDLPLLEESPGPLGFPLRRLIVGGPVGEPFALAGRHAAAEGTIRGLYQLRIGPIRVYDGPRIDGPADAVVLTPLGAERRIRAGGAPVVERIVIPRDAPVCVVEWVAEGEDVEIVAGWECEPAAGPAAGSEPDARTVERPRSWRGFPRGIAVQTPGAAPVVFLFSDAPASLVVEESPDPDRLRIRARVRLRAGVPMRLAVAGGDDAPSLRRGLAAADRIGSLVRARRGSAARLRAEGLALECPDVEAERAVEWARHELDAGGLGPAGGTRAAASRACAALAAGDPSLAREALQHRGAAAWSVAGPADLYSHLLLAGRYVAWTGDLAMLRAAWPRILPALEVALGHQGDAAELAGEALASLVDAAESIGEGAVAARLRAAAERAEKGQARIGSESPILRVVHDLLGAEPDAPRGRLVLRPEPPPTWDRFSARGLTVGDSAVSLAYERAGGRHTLRVAQTRGASPLRVILEPALPGSALRRAAVDGVPAELDPRVRGDKLVIPLQVVLDHPREVVLELHGSGHDERRRD